MTSFLTPNLFFSALYINVIVAAIGLTLALTPVQVDASAKLVVCGRQSDIGHIPTLNHAQVVTGDSSVIGRALYTPNS